MQNLQTDVSLSFAANPNAAAASREPGARGGGRRALGESAECLE